jgi:hypothetical protein
MYIALIMEALNVIVPVHGNTENPPRPVDPKPITIRAFVIFQHQLPFPAVSVASPPNYRTEHMQAILHPQIINNVPLLADLGGIEVVTGIADHQHKPR